MHSVSCTAVGRNMIIRLSSAATTQSVTKILQRKNTKE